MERKKILIIDDEQAFCEIVKANLEQIGNFQVFISSSGKEGIKVARKIKPDLILLDIMMPKIDGFEVLKTLKKNPETVTIPVVMLTAKDDDTSRFKAFQAYSEIYITKPIGADELKTKIESVLKLRD